jgi:hypothetical protein
LKFITDEPLLSVASSSLVDINLDLRDEHKESRILDFNPQAVMRSVEASESYGGFLRYTLSCNVAGVDTSQQRVGRGL